MTKQALAEILVKLYEELQKTPTLDDDDRVSMQVLAGEIQAALDRSAHPSTTESTNPPAISKRVEDSIQSFEAHHPQLTTILSQIADRLADMGI
jgi:Domain of unknown function (DUF4404)